MKKTIKAWIARDKDGQILPFNEHPQREDELGYWTGNIPRITDENISDELASKLTWEGEPIQVEIIIKEKK